MELNKAEVNVVEIAVKEANEEHVRLLNELQLSLIGGGIADVVFG